MKKLIFLFTVATLLSSVGAAQVTVSVHKTDNTVDNFHMDPSGEMYFSNGHLQISESALTDNTGSWYLDEIRKVTFGPESTPTSIAQSELSAGIALYPNPAHRSFAIAGIGTAPTTVSIFTIAGRKVAERTCTEGQNIDVSNLTQGIYFVRVGERTAKLILH